MLDTINLSIRIALLLLIGATVQTAMSKRMWAIFVFALTVWFLTFRLTLLRAVSIYAGVFSHEKIEFVDNLKNVLVSGWFNNFLDILFLIGAFVLYIYVAHYHYIFKSKEVSKYGKKRISRMG